METEEERKARSTGEYGSYHTAQVGPGDRGRKKSKHILHLIWSFCIDIGIKKKKFFKE